MDLIDWIVVGVVVIVVLSILRLPGFRSGSPQNVVLPTRQTPWQVVRADIGKLLQIIVSAVLVGLLLVYLLYQKGVL